MLLMLQFTWKYSLLQSKDCYVKDKKDIFDELDLQAFDIEMNIDIKLEQINQTWRIGS